MLEQMREAGLALGLVLGPDIVPDADRDDRRLVILVDDAPSARSSSLKVECGIDTCLTSAAIGTGLGASAANAGCGQRGRGDEQGKAAAMGA